MKSTRAHKYSISFSIAFSRVAEWFNEPGAHPRPSPDILRQAKSHATNLGDLDRVSQIETLECENKRRDSVHTPPSFPAAQVDAKRDIKVFKAPGTRPFDRNIKIRQTIVVTDRRPDATEIDHVLDTFIRSFS